MALIVRDLGRCEYGAALALQEEIVARKIGGDDDDHLLLVEHPPVYTLGRGAAVDDLLGADVRLGVPVFRVGRGGGVTFHGPGQLVAYPITRLSQGGRDVHRYVRNLERCLIRVCEELGIPAHQEAGRTGVWVGGAKLASIGVGVRRWTTFHGIALNISTDLRFFAEIVPCRMPEVRMTSLLAELGAAPDFAAVQRSFVHQFEATFGYCGNEQVQVAPW
ncbi:MAG: lipoyl(octanoyl) transferase LipB [Deltaproteobacteria bacterium]|nr:lipoyl(octanoyl) transferase LipB [Deltaproteobacteria bacterium]